MKDTKQTGDISTAMVMGALLRSGKNVLIPFGDRHRYDLVVEEGGAFVRVQCKTGRSKGRSIKFNTCSVFRDPATKRYKKRSYGTEVDAYGVYCPETNLSYLIPSKLLGPFEGRLAVRPALKGGRPILSAKDFILGELPER